MSEISKSLVSLRIFGKDLNPDEMTVIMRCQPTRSGKKGDMLLKNGNYATIKTGSWSIEFQGEASASIEEKILRLLEDLPEDIGIWEKITTDYQADLFCGLFLDQFNEGFDLSADVMKKLGDRGLRIGFDIYTP